MTQPNLFNPNKAAALKKAGIESAENNSREFVRKMRDVAFYGIAQNGSITTDELREHAVCIGLEPHHPNAWGCIFKDKRFKPIGWRKSKITTNHGRMIRLWGLA